MVDYVAYYRVSTDRQGASGLGLDAQKQTVASFVKGNQLLAEFTEVESGRRHTNRPELLAALEECRKRRAVLVIARLNRLARNVAFISALMETKIEFVACDMPSANRLTIHILAAVAEYERGIISSQTKDALAEAKRRGTTLGNPRLHEARIKAREKHRASRPAPEVLALMTGWREQGWALRRIADELNRLKIKPARGQQWYASSVNNQIADCVGG